MSEIDAEKLAVELGKRGEEWADTNAALAALEDYTKTILAEEMRKRNEPTVADREAGARVSPPFKEHLDALDKARHAANRAKAKYDTFRAYIELLRSQQATERAAMQLR